MTQPDLYADKEQQYFGVEQKWVADLIEGRNLRILDVGCGDGQTGALLKREGIAKEVHGIEIVEATAQRASNWLDTVITGNIETLELPFESTSFDVIVITEVLEHLVDPWSVVRRLKNYLRNDGIIIASVPNVRNLSVIWRLVTGRWRYTDSGILDKTHLRFFTKTLFVELFTQADMSIDRITPIMNYNLYLLNRFLLGLPEEFFTHRYSCRVKKNIGI